MLDEHDERDDDGNDGNDDDHPVAVHDGVEPVGYGEHCAVGKLLPVNDQNYYDDHDHDDNDSDDHDHDQNHYDDNDHDDNEDDFLRLA